MQVFECAEELGRVEPATMFVEFSLTLQVVEQLSTINWYRPVNMLATPFKQ